MKQFKILSAIIGILVVAQSANAQEYDDLYFSTKDRIKLKKTRGDIQKPENVSSKFYYATPQSSEESSVAETPAEATFASAKFANPDFQGEQTQVLDESEVSYYEAPNTTPFTNVNPRPGQNAFFDNTNNWNVGGFNAMNPAFAMGMGAFNSPFMNPAFAGGFYDPFWGNPGWVDPVFMSPMQRWNLRNQMLFGGWNRPFNRFNVGIGVGFGWGGFNTWNRFGNPWGWGGFNTFGNPWVGGFGAWGNPWCGPFVTNNVFVANNRFIGRERFVRNVYRGPIGRRSSVGTNLRNVNPNRTSDVQYANNQRAAMNRRYADRLNSRRSSASTNNRQSSNGKVSSFRNASRRGSSNTVVNPRNYSRSSNSSVNRSGNSSFNRSTPSRRSSSPSLNRSRSNSSRSSSTFRSSSPSRSSGSINRSSSGSRRSSGGSRRR